jgi:hypothetical protein
MRSALTESGAIREHWHTGARSNLVRGAALRHAGARRRLFL